MSSSSSSPFSSVGLIIVVFCLIRELRTERAVLCESTSPCNNVTLAMRHTNSFGEKSMHEILIYQRLFSGSMDSVNR